MNTAKFVLNHLSQSVMISRMMTFAVQDMPQIYRGVYELLINAFEHGVYQLGFDLKKELIANKKYFSELNKRVRDPAYKNKHIEVILHKKEDNNCINISDPGLGFDHQAYMGNDSTQKPMGHGIFYAANYCFDQLNL